MHVHQVEFTRLRGVAVLNRILDTPSIPLQAAICRAVCVLLKTHQVALSFAQNGLIDKMQQLLLLDDPALQCEAAAVILRVVQYHNMRVNVVAPAKLRPMLLSDYEDNHVACTRVLCVLATHDAALRAELASLDGVVAALVQHCRAANFELRQNAIQTLAYLGLDDAAARLMGKAGILPVCESMMQQHDVVIVTHALMTLANVCRLEELAATLFSPELVDRLCDVGYRPEIGLAHLICGVLSNLAALRRSHAALVHSRAVTYAVRMLKDGSLHARYVAAGFLRKLCTSPDLAEVIVSAGALPPLVDMARHPRILVDTPNPMGVTQKGRSLYLHWQAGRCVAALAGAPKNHMAILSSGAIFSLVQICQSGMTKLCKEGAYALAFMADVRCEDEVILQMAKDGAIPVLTLLTRNPDQDTATEAEMALSSLLNFDSTWVG